MACNSFPVLFIPVSCRLSSLVPLPLYQLTFSIIWVSGNIVGVIILGTLMILIPGAYFVNAIREFTQNNYYSGLALMLSGVSTCLSISVGVLAMISLLPFAEQLSGMFSTPSTSWLGVLIQTFMAGLGTAAFSVLYRVPKKYFLDLGTLGAAHGSSTS